MNEGQQVDKMKVLLVGTKSTFGGGLTPILGRLSLLPKAHIHSLVGPPTSSSAPEYPVSGTGRDAYY